MDGQNNDSEIIISSAYLLAAGGVAGCSAKTLTAPLDRIKILYQVNPKRNFTFSKAKKTTKLILQHTGIRGLWRGNSASIARVAPFSAIGFMTQHHAKDYLITEFDQESNIWIEFVSGSIAGLTASILTYPLDVLRARMAAHWSIHPKYNGILPLWSILRTDGLRSLFTGLSPTLLGAIPYVGINFAIYETIKKEAKIYFVNDVPMWFNLAGGGFAGFIATTSVYPLHVVRRRIQVQEKKILYRSTLDALKTIYVNEGWRAFYKGLSLTYIKSPFMIGVSFCINDYLKKCFHIHRMEEDLMKSHENNISQNKKKKYLLPFWMSFLSGGCGGAVAKTLIAPADRIKILYQVNDKRKFTYGRAFRTGCIIASNTGLKGLWRGHAASLLKIFPSNGISFMFFPRYENLFGKFINTDVVFGKGVNNFLSGAAAGLTAQTMTYPLEVLRARQAAHWSVTPLYHKYATALNVIGKKRGLSGLFAGLKPTAIGVIPYAGINFGIYETSKSLYMSHYMVADSDVPTLFRLQVGACTGWIAQSATYPLDVVRRRMMVSNTQLKWLPLLIKIYQTEGIKHGLYKGLTMNWIKGPISVAVSFTTRDLIQNYLRKQRDRKSWKFLERVPVV